MSNIVPFSFGSHQVRVVTDDTGEPLFVAKDVAEALGYSDTTQAVRNHCKHAKPLKDINVDSAFLMSLDPQTKVIQASDVYLLVLRSRMPHAESALEVLLAQVSDSKAILKALRDFEVPDDLPDMYVYAIREKDTGNIKLGISRDPEARLRQLQTGNSSELELVAHRPAVNRFADERAIHANAATYRLKGEWFKGAALEVLK